ncbi:hypothetical protein JCM19240_1216 [Vibrio maritimus]|uniref:Uncharacterized protein n=1 Tax=Vibrio maritimus TaxID=990268 RepID=A0A090T4Z3_9VIBR|nr:hypothetical protein JCM19240_1216 [Vibrio maritimus]
MGAEAVKIAILGSRCSAVSKDGPLIVYSLPAVMSAQTVTPQSGQ